MVSDQRFRGIAVVACGLLALEIAVANSGLLSWDHALALNKAWEMAVLLTAIGAYAWTARRSHGAERRWRAWMAVAMTSLAAGLAAWSWGQVIAGIPLPTTSAGPAGFLLAPLLAVLAVLHRTFGHGTDPLPPVDAPRRTVRALDLAVILSSLALFTWITFGESLSRGWTGSGYENLILVAHPLAYLLLVAVILVLTRTRRIVRQGPMLWCALGALAYVVSSGLFAHAVRGGLAPLPLIEAGFMACPVFFGLAALAPSPVSLPALDARRLRAVDSLHHVVPYLPPLAAGLVVAVGVGTGLSLGPGRTALAAVVLALILLRQAVSVIGSTHLLREISLHRDRFQYLALHDPLTGLANRSLLLHDLSSALARRSRRPAPLTVLYIDLDDFKEINDELGHATGDQVLADIGRRLRAAARAADTVARLGGDEFAVLLHEASSPGFEGPPEHIGERFLAVLAAPHLVGGSFYQVSASIGLIHLDAREPSPPVEALLDRADRAMYSAKRAGKNSCVTKVYS